MAIAFASGYSISQCAPFARVYTSRTCAALPDKQPTALVEMLFCTSLLAVVPSDAQATRLQMVNTKRESVICELAFPDTIECVRLNRRRLVVAAGTALHAYDIGTMKRLHTLQTGGGGESRRCD